MRYQLKALNTNNRDLKTALLFSQTVMDRNYLFSCPDGFQRVANLQKMKFGKVKFVFVPSLSPNHFGGLPGFFLSAREASSANAITEKDFKMILIGPEHIKETLSVAHSFMGDFESHLDVYGVPQDLSSMPDSQMSHEEETKDQEKVFHDQKGNIINGVLKSLKTEHDIFEFMPETNRLAYSDEFLTIYPVRAVNASGEDPCFSFIGVPAQANAKFIPQAAKALGCDPKKHFKELANGIPVTLDNGIVVTPDQVQEPKLPSQAFVLVFLPSVDYIDSFVGSNQDLFEHFQAGHSDEKFTTSVVYHSVPKTCIENPTYRKEFMLKFGSNVTHLLDCPETNKQEYARAKAFALSDMIKQICPLVLPVTQQDFEDYNYQNRLDIDQILKQESEMLKFAHSQLGMTWELYPEKHAGLDLKSVIAMTEDQMHNDQKVKAEIRMVVDGLKQMLFDEETKQKIAEASLADPLTSESNEPQILFLGTSSMKPTSYRGASAIYLLHKQSGILMDCAEGSYGQLWDHFGSKEKVDQVLKMTRVIFITHIHGDHQLGVLKILLERDNLMNQDSTEKLYIVTPQPMLEWMTKFKNQLKNRPDLFELVPSHTLNPEKYYYYQKFDFDSYQDIEPENSRPSKDICIEKPYDQIQANLNEFTPETDNGKEMWAVLKDSMDIERLVAVEVDHCPQSYACMIEGGFGKIVYSGDTLPCQNLINYGQKATLLIHEATLQDGMEQDAQIKKHTTTSQAIEVGQKCGAWRTILTHFSPRYQKIAETSQKHIENKVMIAFDHTRLSLSHFEWAYKLILLYQKLLSNDDQEANGDKPDKKQENQPKVKLQKQQQQKLRTKSPKK